MTSIDNIRLPRTRKDGLAALNMRRARGENREVTWHHIETRAVSPVYPINVPKDSTLLIRVRSGVPRLVVESGHVTIEFYSVWGNSLDILPGASAHITAGEDTKVSINNEGTLTVDAPEKNRVRVFGPGQTTGVEPIRPLGSLT